MENFLQKDCSNVCLLEPHEANYLVCCGSEKNSCESAIRFVGIVSPVKILLVEPKENINHTYTRQKKTNIGTKHSNSYKENPFSMNKPKVSSNAGRPLMCCFESYTCL